MPGNKKTAECSVCQKPVVPNKTGLCSHHAHLDPDIRAARAERMRQRWLNGPTAQFRRGGGHVKMDDIPAEMLDDYRNLARKRFRANDARKILGLPPRKVRSK